MENLKINLEKLERFETELDPQDLGKSLIPVSILGYGEISTVLDIDMGDQSSLAYKRMPLFNNAEEADNYEGLYREYVKTLQNTVGLNLVPDDLVRVVNRKSNQVVVYILQEKLNAESVGHKAIQYLHPEDVNNLILAILTEMKKVFDFNSKEGNGQALGLDGQISNWAIEGFDVSNKGLPKELKLIYIDTSTPLMTKNGQEQLDSELFLRSAPSFLVWLLRLFFLDDVLTRYYDFRKVAIDLIANFYKEQRPELIPRLIETANQFFADQIEAGDFKPLTLKEIKAYYQEDAIIWRLYLAFRKIDRTLHRWLRKDYPYILPVNINR